MDRSTDGAHQLRTSIEVGPVVDVASVERAATRRHQARVAQLAQVVRDEVLRLTDQLGQLAHAAIAAGQLRHDPPTQRIAEEPEDRRRGSRSGGVTRPTLHQFSLM